MTRCTPELRNGEYVCTVCGWGEGRGYTRRFTKRCSGSPCGTMRGGRLKMPSLKKRAWNLAGAVKDFVGDGCKLVDADEYARRLAVCDACELRSGNWCSECGCSLTLKAKGRAFRCPVGQWEVPTKLKPRLRVALWSPGLRMGGAERWIVDLATHLPRDRFDVSCLCIGRSDCDPHLRAIAERAGVVVFDRAECRRLFSEADVVVFWGSKPAGYPKHSVFCSHGGGAWAKQLSARITDWGVRLTAVSDWARRAFPEGADVTVLHNGVDPARLEPIDGRDATRERLGLRPSELCIGFVGRMTKIKNPLSAIEAAENMGRPARALYVGPAEQPVAAALEERGAILAGRVEQIGDLYAAMDCFMLASPSEGFSLARIEAWQCGVPTVSTPVGAVPEVEEQYGQMTVRVPVEPTGEQLAAAVEAAISPDCRPIVENAQRVAREHFTARAMAARWADYLEEVVAK